jgi:hypothetical protein
MSLFGAGEDQRDLHTVISKQLKATAVFVALQQQKLHTKMEIS